MPVPVGEAPAVAASFELDCAHGPEPLTVSALPEMKFSLELCRNKESKESGTALFVLYKLGKIRVARLILP